MSRFPAPSSAAVVVVTALLAAATARAEPVRVVVWPRAPDDPTDAAERAARQAKVTVVPFAPLAARLGELGAAELDRERSAVDAVAAALQQARADALARRWTGMATGLTAAETAAVGVLGQPGHTETLWELELQLGLAALWGGEPAAARARFLLALDIDADRAPSRGLYAPDVLRAFTEAVDARAAKPARPVALRVSPADARVVIDGAPVIDNQRSRQLRPGLHIVVATAPGYAASARVVDVAAQTALEVSLEPITGDAATRIGASWSTGRLDPTTRSGRAVVAAAVAELGATAALVIDVAADGTAATARLVTADEAQPVHRKPSVDAAVRAALARPTVATAIHPRDDGDDDDRFIGSGWFYAALAGGVAIVATAVGVGVALQQRDHIGEILPPRAE